MVSKSFFDLKMIKYNIHNKLTTYSYKLERKNTLKHRII